MRIDLKIMMMTKMSLSKIRVKEIVKKIVSSKIDIQEIEKIMMMILGSMI
jgi:hypothetical protein